MTDGVLIVGASRGTGLEVARLLEHRGESVTAFVRPTTDMAELLQLKVKLFRGDVLDPRSVQGALASGSFRAVINTVGGKRGEPRPDYHGTRNVVDAALKAGVRRHLFVTAIGAGDSRGAVGPKVLQFLGPVLEEKTLGENYLMASGLDYTILRPGGMTNNPASGTAIRSEDRSVMGVINRADLARLVVECLDDPLTIGKVFHTIDPAITEQAPLQRGEDLPGGRVT
ncbi:MAG: SDR family oxidoreductase [Gammaproteobacteria bacterium]|nr:SDR family oxidoreductase [Gammaproteobacteria bacterium]